MLCINFKGVKWRKQADGCVFYMKLWARVVVKWSHSPDAFLHSISECVCICRPLTSACGICLRSLLSISDASGPGPQTHTQIQTQAESMRSRASHPGSSWLHTPTLTGFTHTRKMINCTCVYIPPCSKRRPQAPTRTYVHRTHLNTLIK